MAGSQSAGGGFFFVLSKIVPVYIYIYIYMVALLMVISPYIYTNFSGSNTDGSFTTVLSNSFLSPLEKSHSCRSGITSGVFLFHIEKRILCVLISIASMRRF